MLNIDEFAFGKIISRNATSTILLGSHKKTSNSVMIKYSRIPSKESPLYYSLLNELIILSKSFHPNIVKLLGYSEKNLNDENENFIATYLVMESMNMTLKEIIKEKKRKNIFFSIFEIKKFIHEIFSAFFFLEKEQITYQDIKPINIMIDNEGNYKLIDFKSAKNLFGLEYNSCELEVIGTLSYSSPEKLQSLSKNQSKLININPIISDVFSFGLVLLEISTLKKIKNFNSTEEFQKIISLQIDQVEDRYNKSLGIFLRMLLETDWQKRKSFVEISEMTIFDFFLTSENLNENIFNLDPKNFQLKKKGSFHSVGSSEIQSAFPNDDREMKEGFLKEVDNLLKEAEKYRKISQYSKALEIFEKCFKIKCENVKNMDDLQASSIYTGIGNVCLELGNFKKGFELHEKALIIRKKIVGENSKLTGDSYNSLGVAFHGQGNYEKSLEFFEKALNIYEKIYGLDNKNTSMAYNNVGGAYSLLGKYEKALEFKNISLKTKIKVLGEENEEIAWAYDNVSIEYTKLGKLDDALIFRQNALHIRRKIYGEKHSQTALSYYYLAQEYLNLKNYQKALEMAFNSLNIRLILIGKNHCDTANSYNQIGECYFKLNDKKNSLENSEKCFNIRVTLLGEQHEDTIKVKKLLFDINNIN